MRAGAGPGCVIEYCELARRVPVKSVRSSGGTGNRNTAASPVNTATYINFKQREMASVAQDRNTGTGSHWSLDGGWSGMCDISIMASLVTGGAALPVTAVSSCHPVIVWSPRHQASSLSCNQSPSPPAGSLERAKQALKQLSSKALTLVALLPYQS